ncbi:hypothetical protein GCM10027570_30110 [Streptomonospora sediminis]
MSGGKGRKPGACGPGSLSVFGSAPEVLRNLRVLPWPVNPIWKHYFQKRWVLSRPPNGSPEPALDTAGPTGATAVVGVMRDKRRGRPHPLQTVTGGREPAGAGFAERTGKRGAGIRRGARQAGCRFG